VPLVCRYRRRCSQQNGVLHGRPELNTKGGPACPRSPAAECRQGAAASGAGAEDRSCSTATYRPGNGADSEHAAEYPGAFTPVLLLLLHEFPRSGDIFTGFRVQVLGHMNSHICPFPGMPDRHPRAGCRQRLAIGVESFVFLPGQGFCSRVNVLSR